MILGIPLALVARVGNWPKRIAVARPSDRPAHGRYGVRRPAAGMLGWLLGRTGVVVLVEPLATEVPADKHVAFLAALWVDSASYLFGFVGGVVVTAGVARPRRRPAQ